MEPATPVHPPVEEPSGDFTGAVPSWMIAQSIYTLVIGALAVADKDVAEGAAERRKMIAFIADAYFPLTGLEKPAWTYDASEGTAASADESSLN